MSKHQKKHFYGKEIPLPGDERQAQPLFHAFLSLAERDAWVKERPYQVQGGGRFSMIGPTGSKEKERLADGKVIQHFKADSS